MPGSALSPALVAIVLGCAIALVILTPVVALQYRRRGELHGAALLVHFAVLVYALAIVAYTILPLPVVEAGFCNTRHFGPQLDLTQFLRDIVKENRGGLAGFPRNPALQQVVLNVVLFVPLGLFVRRLGRWGIPATAALGLCVSLLVEATQLTGDWFLFPCAYRLFDVDDLLANTLGAFVGALLATLLHPRAPKRTGPTDDSGRPVTVGRRLLGMVADVSFVAVIARATSAAIGLVLLLAGHIVPTDDQSTLRALASSCLPALVELLLVLRTGRTVGEWAVRIMPVPPIGWRARGVRWMAGIGGLTALAATTHDFLALILVLSSIVAVFSTRGHRGLAYALVRWELEDERRSDASTRSRQVKARP